MREAKPQEGWVLAFIGWAWVTGFRVLDRVTR